LVIAEDGGHGGHCCKKDWRVSAVTISSGTCKVKKSVH